MKYPNRAEKVFSSVCIVCVYHLCALGQGKLFSPAHAPDACCIGTDVGTYIVYYYGVA